MAVEAIPWFRDLYNDINEYKGHALYYDVLTPWIDKAGPDISSFARFKSQNPFDRRDDDASLSMQNLYALNRVNDLLLLRFQGDASKPWEGPKLYPHEYLDFFTRLGFDAATSERFSSFHHEIVRVQQSNDENEPVGILETLWPGFMFGDMMFSRAGVEVIAGRKHAIKEVAEQSTLYFTYLRANRETSDLSMGWGSNSQWRTCVRRDYESNGMWVYNADGTNLLNAQTTTEPDRDGLTREERIELCRNRCFVVTSKPHDDLWPFDDRLEEPIRF